MARTGAALCLAVALALPAAAQEPPPFLLLNQERILTGSQAGQALLAEEEAARDALRAEARDIDARFEAEERRLTEQRAELEPEAFREIADDFDARVIEARREQDARSNALAAEYERRRRQFYNEVGPILVDLLSRYGAHAVFDESTVLLADQSLNITDAVIAEIDARAAEPGNEDAAEAVGAQEGDQSAEPPTGGAATGTGASEAAEGAGGEAGSAPDPQLPSGPEDAEGAPLLAEPGVGSPLPRPMPPAEQRPLRAQRGAGVGEADTPSGTAEGVED